MRKGILRNFAKFTGKHLYQSLFQEGCGPEACNFIKKRVWHRCFPVNCAKFLRTPFLQNNSGRLLQHLATVLKVWIFCFSIRKNFKKECQWRDCLWFNELVSCTNTRPYKKLNYYESICLSFKIEIWHKKSMMTQAFVWMNITPAPYLYFDLVIKG